MPILVHADKNQEPDGRWLLSIVVEETNDTGETSKVVSQTNSYFETEPQIQYQDWS